MEVQTPKEIHARISTKSVYKINEISYCNFKNLYDKKIFYVFWKTKEEYTAKCNKKVEYWSTL